MGQPNLLRLKSSVKERLKILFLAKWAEGDGTPDSQDGTHSTYHYELRETLKNIGFQVEASGRYERLFEEMNFDFLLTLFNRGGFTNSEMLAPLLATYRSKPFLGATPIIRGLGDDKHLMKLATRSRGISTPDWQIYRRGCLTIDAPTFPWKRLITKPNASSASWGIMASDNWADAKAHIEYLHNEGHDAIVENFVDGYELAIPIIGARGPMVLPIVRFHVDDEMAIRSYEQKRHLTPSDEVGLEICQDGPLVKRLEQIAHDLLPEIWPFDYGRIEVKYDEKTDTINFIEINLSCNLWSKKALPFAARAGAGIAYPDLVETILCHSMLRQGVITEDDLEN
jgi:D-alanine-D-alanine ligase